MRRLFASVLVVTALLALSAGCGDDDDTGTGTEAETAATTAASSPPLTATPGIDVEAVENRTSEFCEEVEGLDPADADAGGEIERLSDVHAQLAVDITALQGEAEGAAFEDLTVLSQEEGSCSQLLDDKAAEAGS
jgi:hypothetical protein